MKEDWRSRQGRALESEVRLSLQSLKGRWNHFWFQRMYDTRTFQKINEKLVAPPQPCDFIVVSNGRFYGLECKSSHSKGRYGFDYVREHQKKSLLEIEKAGGEGWILLGWRRWEKESRKPNRLFGFRIQDWLKMEKDEPLKSVSWQTIIQRGVEFERKGVWNLEKMFVKVKQ